MSESEFQQVTVGVPAARVPEFYEMFGRWLRERDAADGGESAPEQDLVAFADAPFERVAAWWKLLKPAATRILLHLAEHPERRFGGTEIAVACNIEKGAAAVAGTLSWPGTHATRAKLEYPFRWDRDQQKYWMTRAVAKVIKEAHRAAGSST